MATASIVGGATSALADSSDDSRWTKMKHGLIGALAGVFFGPAIADLIGVHDDHNRIATGFGVGLIGVMLVTGIMTWARGQSISDWVARFIGKKPLG